MAWEICDKVTLSNEEKTNVKEFERRVQEIIENGNIIGNDTSAEKYCKIASIMHNILTNNDSLRLLGDVCDIMRTNITK